MSLNIWYGALDILSKSNKRPPFINFIKPIVNKSFEFEATDAVKDLQVNSYAGGINLAETKVKNHLIASDIDLYSTETALHLADIDKYLELIDDLIGVAQDIGGWGPKTQLFLDGLSKLNKTARIFTFLEWYSKEKGFNNFLGDGDAIVPLSSQLAGFTSSLDNVTVFTSPSFTQTLNYWHCVINNRTDVGDKVKLLLNSSIYSSLFGSSIPATPTSPLYIKKITDSKSEIKTEIKTELYDTLKIKIISPLRSQILFADSTISIQYNLKDTVNLVNVKLFFQTESYSTANTSSYQEYITQISPDLMGKQLIYAVATYRINGLTEKYIDTLSVNIQTTATLIDFMVSPTVSSIQKNKPFYPSYAATYNTFLANIPFNDPQITVAIDNPLVASFNPTGRYFEGVCDSTSSTFAVISYKGLKDTIYIEVQASEDAPIGPSNKALSISALLEGLYNGSGTMRQARDANGPYWPAGVADHITVELHDATTYSTIVYSVADIPISTAGVAMVTIPGTYNGSYFITIKHRNSLETTTATAISFAGSTINQSFTVRANVYGGNLGLSIDGYYLIYGGDINQDGIINSADYTPVINDNAAYAKGYLSSDVDGNGIVNSGDYTTIINNNSFYIKTLHP